MQVVSLSPVIVFYFPLKLDHYLAIVVSAAGLVVSLFPLVVFLVVVVSLSPPIVCWLDLFLTVAVVSVADSPLLLMIL